MRIDNSVPEINHRVGLVGWRCWEKLVYLTSCIALQGTESKRALLISLNQKLYEAITQIACAIE